MTALTPEQMQELADVCFDCEGTLAQCKAARVACCPDCQHYKPRIVALRAAADQLDAVQRFASVRATAAHALGREAERDWLDLLAILTAGTAPQDLS